MSGSESEVRVDPLERAHRHVTHAGVTLRGDYRPTVGLEPAARALERALGSIFDAIDARTDPLTSAQAAGDALGEARTALARDASGSTLVSMADHAVQQAQQCIDEAVDTLKGRPVAPERSHAEIMYASGDLPQLHHVERPSLVFDVEVPAALPEVAEPPAPLPKAATFEELRANVAELSRRKLARELRREADAAAAELAAMSAAEVSSPAPLPPGFDPGHRKALSELEYIRERARFHFEEVTMTGLQRLPMDGDGWRDVLIIEQRMLRAIDTIVAFGPSAVAVLEPLVNDAPAKDAARVFALTMTLGCVAGRDALAAAERVFYAFEAADLTVRDGFADALKLIPHDHVHGLLTDWLRASDVHHRAIAIDVLGHRGAATEAQLLAAAEDDPVVAAMALPHLARLAPGRCGPPIDAALAAGADRLPLWQAMVLSDHRGTRMMLAEAVSNPELRGSPLRDGAARLLGVVGDRDDGASLADAMEDAPTPAGVEALGWIGDPKAFPVLLRLLEHEDELVGWAAGRALDRITGAWLVDLVELDAEEIHVELPPDPKVGYADEPLVKKVSDPRDVPAEPSKEMVERPSRDPARWSAWIAEHGQELRAGRRFRRGRPYAPQLTFDELDGPVATLQERALLATELVVRTGRALRFSPFDFVRVQEQSLEEWRPVAARSVTSGSWDRPGRR